jgi:hypothetical protein
MCTLLAHVYITCTCVHYLHMCTLFVHVYITCTPRYHICGVQTSHQKMVYVLCTHDIFSHILAHNSCSCTTSNSTLLKSNNHCNINFLLLLLLPQCYYYNIIHDVHKIKNHAICVKSVTFNTTFYDIITYTSYL